jgi:hypothetical protein
MLSKQYQRPSGDMNKRTTFSLQIEYQLGYFSLLKKNLLLYFFLKAQHLYAY